MSGFNVHKASQTRCLNTFLKLITCLVWTHNSWWKEAVERDKDGKSGLGWLWIEKELIDATSLVGWKEYFGALNEENEKEHRAEVDQDEAEIGKYEERGPWKGKKNVY